MTEKVAAVKKTFVKVKTQLEKIDARIRLHHHKIGQFKSNVSFEFERGGFIVKTAENGEELERCLKLRYEVFHREYRDKKRKIGIDIDKLDFLCDHLMIIEKTSLEVIGTYRLNCSKFTQKFYSAGEFKIDKILNQPGTKLELGRACIAKPYRTGSVLNLLWRAIADYLVRTESQYLFGCASVKTTDKRESAIIYEHLRQKGHLDPDYDVVPTRKYRMSGLVPLAEELAVTASDEVRAAAEKIPPLFLSYLKMGVRVCGEPALDKDFQCIDFLTLLKMEELHPIFLRKYKL
jgi:putative hemolysin